ncbi:hypothetical protein GQ600_10190 [Phytophthora cactorum]|nr:hypothetical protein GQ600_10190 [Phytophthora cactorum]
MHPRQARERDMYLSLTSALVQCGQPSSSSRKCKFAWRQIQCIVVDKDFTKIAVFSSELPQAMILYTDCPFQMLVQVTKRHGGTWYIAMTREVSCPCIRQFPAEPSVRPGVELLVDVQARTSVCITTSAGTPTIASPWTTFVA